MDPLTSFVFYLSIFKVSSKAFNHGYPISKCVGKQWKFLLPSTTLILINGVCSALLFKVHCIMCLMHFVGNTTSLSNYLTGVMCPYRPTKQELYSIPT